MKLSNKILLAAAAAVSAGTGILCAKNIQGVVVDSDGTPIAGAMIQVPGTMGYFTTNADGTFFAEADEAVTTAQCSFLGYKDAEFDINADAIKVVLTEDAAKTDELLDVAAHKQVRRTEYTGAIVTVTADQLATTPATGLEEALRGYLPGYISLQSSSDGPGDSGGRWIRGLNSYTDSQIMVVLDGAPALSIDLNTIDPRTVESVSILKDAAAKAIYGPKAAQGVILITTKRGKVGKTRVKVSANMSLEQPTKSLDTRDSYSYAQLRNQALRNDNLEPAFSNAELQAFADGTGTNNLWTDMFLKDLNTVQNYSVDVSGGNNRVQYYVNGGYTRKGSLYKYDEADRYNPGNTYNRFTVVSGVNVNMFKFLKAFINTNVRIKRENESRTGTGTIMSRIYSYPSTLVGGLSEDGKVITNSDFSNPLYGSINRVGSTLYTGTDINGSFGLDLDMSFLTPGLSARGIMGYQSYYGGTITKSRDFTRYVYDNNGELVPFGSSIDSPVSLSKGSSTVYFINIQAYIEYQRRFGKHLVEAQAGYFAEDRISSRVLPYYRIEYNGRLKYGFDDRYFIEGIFTHAASGSYAEGNRFHFSPTVSAAWVASNEEFLKDVEWLNNLKIRASYGNLASDNVDAFGTFLYRDNYRSAGGGLVSTYYTGTLIQAYERANPNLRMERSKQQNYGIDLTLFNQFTLNFDYWATKQTGMLVRGNTTPALGGVPNSYLPVQNIGEMKNRGFELMLGYNKKLAPDFSINAFAGIGYNKNEVVYTGELDRSMDKYAYPYREQGYSLGQQFGYLIDYSNGNGFFNSQDEIDRSGLTYEGTQPRVGDFIYRDLNNDGIINERDQAPLDNAKTVPSFEYSFGAQVNYRNFDFNLLFQGIGGYSRVLSGLGVYETSEKGVYTEMHEHAWTAERYAAGEEILYPALTSTTSSSLKANDFFCSKSDFLRLKNLTVGYTIPQSISRQVHIDKLRIYFSGENLLTFTNMKFKDIDPEKGSIGYPIMRTFNFGLNVNF